MTEAAGKEFWREFKPVAQVFRPGAMPEAYIANAATDDERFYAPLSETGHPAAVDLPQPEPVVRRADVPRRGAGEPALPPAAGVRLHVDRLFR